MIGDPPLIKCCLNYFHRYGLGTCYMRMSRLRLAEYHYGKAAEIHPHNAVLLGCVGMVSLSMCPGFAASADAARRDR